MKKLLTITLSSAVVIAAVMLAIVIPQQTAQAQFDASSFVITTQIMGSVVCSNLGVDVTPVPSGYIAVEKRFWINPTNLIQAIRIDEMRQTNAQQGIVITTSNGVISEARSPSVDASKTFGVATAGVCVVDYWIKLRQ